MDIPTPSPVSPGKQPKLQFDSHWLAITRAMHPYLSLDVRQPPLPRPHELDPLIQAELDRIQREGLLVPSRKTNNEGEVELVWEKGLVEIARVQQFWPTAPAHGQPGGLPSQSSRLFTSRAVFSSLGAVRKRMEKLMTRSRMVHQPPDRGVLRHVGRRK